VISLLDTNVLVALAWPNHVHHEMAHRWFGRHQPGGWATCPLTQSGFVRVSSNKGVVPEARTPREAIELLRQILELPHHHFWADDVSLPASEFVAPERLVGYRQVTDAHLLAVALRHNGRLATLDRGIRGIVPASQRPDEVVVLILDSPTG